MSVRTDAPPDDRTRTPPEPLDVSRVAANVPFVLRTFAGMGGLVILVNLVGVLVVALTTLATNAAASGHQRGAILTAAIIVVVVQIAVGTGVGLVVQRRTLRWLLRGERPSVRDARRALRIPLDLALIVAALWLVGGIAVSVVALIVGLDTLSVVGLAGGATVAGLAVAGLTYLLVGRITDPITRLALASCPPEEAPLFGVRWRLFTIWLLTSGAPVVGIVLILLATRHQTDVRPASVLVAIVALIAGGAATLLTARAIGAPLRSMVDLLRRVGDGDLDITVAIDDAGEIGLVQNGFNEMVSGLRERDEVKDLFGRHVGSSVAQEALRSGVTLSGELRDVVAIFVDITGSTRLSRTTDPQKFVAMLNRFFEIVVEEVEGNDGLLNKFEGDAALCVFGAPVSLPDAPTRALCAARRIRDRVAEVGEVDIGIGVASGQVVAGQVGTQSRLEYTIIGDAVNEAARLTELAKEYDGNLLTNRSTVCEADPAERAHWSEAGSVLLRGHDDEVTIYRG